MQCPACGNPQWEKYAQSNQGMCEQCGCKADIPEFFWREEALTSLRKMTREQRAMALELLHTDAMSEEPTQEYMAALPHTWSLNRNDTRLAFDDENIYISSLMEGTLVIPFRPGVLLSALELHDAIVWESPRLTITKGLVPHPDETKPHIKAVSFQLKGAWAQQYGPDPVVPLQTLKDLLSQAIHFQ